VAFLLGLLPGAAQQADLLVAADERKIRGCGFELGILLLAQAGDPPHLDRFGDALERVRAETLARKNVADQIAGGGADQNGIGAGEGLQAGGEVGRLADDDEPAGDADAPRRC
jgi:hypothetical protein